MEQQKSQIKPSPYLWGGLKNTSLYTPSTEVQERLTQTDTEVPYRSFNNEADFDNPNGFAVQAFLNSKGYNLKEDGNIGPATRAAIADSWGAFRPHHRNAGLWKQYWTPWQRHPIL